MDYLRSPDGEYRGERSTTGTRYAVLDVLGSTRWLLSGNTFSRSYNYTPDGEDAGWSGSGPGTSILYAGGYQLAGATNRYHYDARYYTPYYARWTQRDPVDQSADLTEANAYMYATGDPINIVDPYGTFGLGDVGKVVKTGLRVVSGAACGYGFAEWSEGKSNTADKVFTAASCAGALIK